MKTFKTIAEAAAFIGILHIEVDGDTVKGYEEGDELPTYCCSEEERTEIKETGEPIILGEK